MGLGDWLRRARFWLRRDRLTDELEEEMRLHIELRAQANRERGLTADEADRAARRQFGNRLALREAGRDAWGFLWLERFVQDLRYGFRQLIRHRGVTLAAVLTLALGIGANTALFTVINTVLIKPAPVPDPSRLVWLGATRPHADGLRAISYPDYLAYAALSEVFEGAIAYTNVHMSVGGEQPMRLFGVIASRNYFDVLGIRAQRGRTLHAGSDPASAARDAVISDELWRTRFGATDEIVGRELRLNGHVFTITGVLPPGFRGLEMPDTEVPAVWVPVEAAPIMLPGSAQILADATDPWLAAAARLRRDVSLAQASAVVAAAAVRVPSASTPPPDSSVSLVDSGPHLRSATIEPLHGGLHPRDRAGVAPVLWLLMVVPALVLVVACANVANLLLARGVARRKELALRGAIGATRVRLVRQLLTESLLLAAAGGLLAMAVAAGFLQAIGTISGVPPAMLAAMTPDARVFGLTMAVGLVAVLVFGLSPALTATSLPLPTALTADAAAVDARGRRRRLRRAFVVTQVAVSMTLLIAAGLLLQSLGTALRVDPGFDARNLLAFSYDLRLQGYTPLREAAFHRDLLDRLQATPGVAAAAFAAPVPLTGEHYGDALTAELGDGGDFPVSYAIVSPGYFATIGVDLVRGRDFSSLDAPEATKVAIVNEALARRLAPSGDVLGRRVRFADSSEPWLTIVGVARDSQHELLTERPRPFLYAAIAQRPAPTSSMLVRLRGDVRTVTTSIAAAVRDLDSDLPLYRMTMLDRAISQSLGPHRAASTLLGVFGAVALLMATLGIYGVTAHAVTLRTREIGIRMSLGARTSQVLRLFVGEGLRLAIAGVVIGVALSAAAVRLLESFLFGVRAMDGFTFGAAALLLAGVAVLASYVPARRAAAVDPLRALRHE